MKAITLAITVVAMLLLTSTTYACCCCKEHNDVTLTHQYHYGPPISYQPLLDPYGNPVMIHARRPWHLGQRAGRAWRVSRGLYVPPLWNHYQIVHPVPPKQ